MTQHQKELLNYPEVQAAIKKINEYYVQLEKDSENPSNHVPDYVDDMVEATLRIEYICQEYYLTSLFPRKYADIMIAKIWEDYINQV